MIFSIFLLLTPVSSIFYGSFLLFSFFWHIRLLPFLLRLSTSTGIARNTNYNLTISLFYLLHFCFYAVAFFVIKNKVDVRKHRVLALIQRSTCKHATLGVQDELNIKWNRSWNGLVQMSERKKTAWALDSNGIRHIYS